MWMWTLDEQLLNLGQVETVNLVPVYSDDADLDTLEEVDPVFYEVIAFLGSGGEVVLFQHPDESLALQALELLAAFIGAHDMLDSFTKGEILSLAELMEKAGNDTKN
jgi:hypothetical protein